MTDAEFEYVVGQTQASFPELLLAYRAESDEIVARTDATIDIRYGRHARQTFDFFPAHSRQPKGTLAYFHAGYWQSRDKSTFRFIAGSFNAGGMHVAMLNYPLCPDVTIGGLIHAASEALPHLIRTGNGLPLVLAGHSAGAHIVVELAERAKAKGMTLAGIAAISGVFDLRPLVTTSLNTRLNLDQATALSVSPLLHVPSKMPPAIFAVGEKETNAFRRQNEQMAMAWNAAGNRSEMHVIDGADHFTILRRLTALTEPLHRAIVALVS